MTVTDLQMLFDYGHWANAKVFGVIEHLPTEQFMQPIPVITVPFGTRWFMS